MNDKNIFKEYGPIFLDKGYSPIPDKYKGKMPAIKAWSDYCHRLPTKEEVKQWSESIPESNISLALGEAGGVIAVDVDTEDEELLELIRKHLYPSPYEKVGNKGFTRFYRYTNENTCIYKHNGSVLFELLSSGKKTTLPPSVHPNGQTYTWSGPSLLEVNPAELPVLPPFNLARIYDMIRAKFPDTTESRHGSFTSNGRNDALVSLCCKLISEKTDLNSAVKNLVEYDRDNHNVPYFTDPAENVHLHAYTNALKMYSYQLNRLNGIHHKKREEYEEPQFASAINEEYKEMITMGKSQKEVQEEKLKRELPTAQGVIATIQKNILDNSWIKQPDLAMAASLGLMSVLCARKFQFGGLSPNLYLLNISPSGSGKDAPQSQIKKYLTDIGKDYLLGAGDYVSDASLMDSLEGKPTRLDIMDEAGGILKTFNKGGSDYNKKMADILCELYTTSSSKFLGRATADGIKGSCYRPNVCILASTTPTGFSEGVSRSAIEKGLLGRFILFFGDGNNPAARLREFPRLDKQTRSFLIELADHQPEVNFDVTIGGIEQRVKDIRASQEAEERLDIVFKEFDNLRRNSDKEDPMLPIISRLYQQMVKISLLSAISRGGVDAILEISDINFGYDLILYYFQNMKDAVKRLVYNTQNEKMYADILKYIPLKGEKPITKQKLSQNTRHLGKRKRDEILMELLETGEIVNDLINKNGRQYQVYWRTK